MIMTRLPWAKLDHEEPPGPAVSSVAPSGVAKYVMSDRRPNDWVKFISFSVSTEYEDDVDGTVVIWLLHSSSASTGLNKIADSDVSLTEVR
ncbi:hypothetical protein WISP_150445 [Willisornis vidua]|uniref:Uncharacterized protein n=1 Tax=Willisornis vidua TaxID=1566151 RepID=A0ABQ9CJS1_9PASS|nr:hypothetical protein WISP_150445 [Willisornis vidua]